MHKFLKHIVYTTLILNMLVISCVFHWPRDVEEKPKDECEMLAKKFNANIIVISEFEKGKSGYASLQNENEIWITSGTSTTKTVHSKQLWQIRSLIAEEMRKGTVLKDGKPKDWF